MKKFKKLGSTEEEDLLNPVQKPKPKKKKLRPMREHNWKKYKGNDIYLEEE